MKFSLILATINRTQELRRFLESLDAQTYHNFELIVVDQNLDDRVKRLVEPYKERFPILYLHSEKGLSRARNFGLKHITGEIVAFPDDDCWYPKDLLERVARFFADNQHVAGLTGRAVDEEDRPVMRWAPQAGWVTKSSVWRKGISYTIFLRSKVIEKVGDFNENLGVGAGTPWGSGEETDYLLRALGLGFRIYYDPNLTVYHPRPPQPYDGKALAKAYKYALGAGYLLKAHHYPLGFVLLGFLRTGLGFILALAQGDLGLAKLRWYSLIGRIRGWLSRG